MFSSAATIWGPASCFCRMNTSSETAYPTSAPAISDTCRECHLLDGEEEPDRERQRLEDPADAEWEPGPAPSGDLSATLGDVGPQAEGELAREDGRQEEEHEDGDRQDRDRDREPHRGLDPDDVDPHEDDVEDRPPERQAVPPCWADHRSSLVEVPAGAERPDDDLLREQAHRTDDH